MNNDNQQVLNRLIELKQVYITDDLYVWDSITKESLGTKVLFNVVDWNATYFCLQRALFDECGKRNYVIYISDEGLNIANHNDMSSVFQAIDTSRESFLQAFKKVTGCE